MTPSSHQQRRLAYIAWMMVCLIWGTTYLGIRISLESMPPALMGGLRWTIAGALLASYVRARGHELPPASRWGGILLLGFLLLVLGNGGVVVAEQWVPSGLAAVLVACAPFWMAAVEACLPDGERLRGQSRRRPADRVRGILVLVWPDLHVRRRRQPSISRGSDCAPDRRLRLVAGFVRIRGGTGARTTCWHHRLPDARRRADDDRCRAPCAESGRTLFHAADRARLAYLSTVGAIGGFVAYTYALRHLPVSFVSLYAYINPVIAVALGVLFLGEPFDRRMAAAAALVFAGVASCSWKKASAGPGSQCGERRAGDAARRHG